MPPSLLKNISFLCRDRVPGQLVIQITSRCNAHCPQCGMRVTADIPRTTLKMDTIKKGLDAAALQGVQAVSFTGGEPLLYLDQVTALITYAGRVGIPYIRTGTNGFLFRNSQAPDFTDRIKRLTDQLAATPLRNFWISLDSAVPEVHEQMRGLANVVKGIERAIPIFHNAGIFPSVNLGINRLIGGEQTRSLTHRSGSGDQGACNQLFYQAFTSAFHRFYTLVTDLGFTIANTCYPMSISETDTGTGLHPVYAANATQDLVRFTSREKIWLYRALMETVQHHRRNLRIFTPVSALHALTAQYEKKLHPWGQIGCRGGTDYFFISSDDGNAYPCGYRGHENLGPFQDLDIRARRIDHTCTRCDWECFRDPSELFSPLTDGLHRPVKLIRRFIRDSEWFSLWQKDIRYYAACDFFNGRVPLSKHLLAAASASPRFVKKR